MSDVAASGGYYIAMPAHAIVAEPATLTGSIGVVMLKFVIDGTLKKLGMNMEGVTSGRYADLYSPVRPFTPEERAKVQEQMQATYDTFVEKAAAGPQHDAGADRRDRAGPRLDRAAGEAARAGRRARRPRARARARQAAREDCRRTAKWSWWSTRGKKSFYDIVRNPFGASDRASALGVLLGFATRGRCRR